VREAYLFGSVARGDSLDVSDIDLLVVSPSVRGLRRDERMSLAYRAWRFRKAADIIILTPEEFERALERSVVLRDARRY
ncbi:nucleotidyltransferase domain-containing protein, partial [Candidatus Bathyarchaeota archaeon]